MEQALAPSNTKSTLKVYNTTWVFAFLPWLVALLLTSALVFSVGESPANVLKILSLSAFGSLENISYTLFYAAPLMLTGTSVALALKAGLFNIGAEGQLYMGALFAAFFGITTRSIHSSGLTTFLLCTFALLFSFLGGALWGGLAGILRARYKVHEVIATILLNFVAYAFTNWAILYPLKNPDTQNPETLWIAQSHQLSPLWKHVTLGLPLSILVAAITLFAIRRTWWGYRVRAVGQNSHASKLAGISVEKTMFLTMALSGGIAGLVGFSEVYCNSYRFIDSFSPSFGFTGLAIGLGASGRFSSLFIASVLFGALHKGALDLDIETEKMTRDLSLVIQAFVLLALALQSSLQNRFKKQERV